MLWFEPGVEICTALSLDPWGVLASGTLLAAFPADGAERAREALADGGLSVATIARAESGEGVWLADGSALVRYERDELSRADIAGASP